MVISKKPLTFEKAIVLVAIVVLAIGIYVWRLSVFASPENTFWGMVNSNLTTNGVTREITQKNGTAELVQKMQLNLGARNYVHGKTIVAQDDEQNKIRVVTESLTTKDQNFVRYTEVDAQRSGEQVRDFSGIVNKWALDENENSGQQNVFYEMVYSIVPFGNLNAQQRQELNEFVRTNNVYDIDFANAKIETNQGKSAYRYNVKINQVKYVELLQKFDQMMNLNQLGGLNSADYEGAQNVALEVVVAIDSRQLLEVNFPAGQRKEKYFAYGATSNLDVPEAVVPKSDLESGLQKLLAQ